MIDSISLGDTVKIYRPGNSNCEGIIISFHNSGWISLSAKNNIYLETDEIDGYNVYSDFKSFQIDGYNDTIFYRRQVLFEKIHKYFK